MRQFQTPISPGYVFLFFKKGEERALGHLYRLFHKQLKSYAYQLLKDDFIIDNAIQDSLLKTWDMRGRMESLQHIYCFMRLNVHWHCLSYFKTAEYRFQAKVIPILSDEELCDSNYADEEALATVLEQESIQREQLQALIACMPDKEQKLISLHYEAGLAHTAIARRMGTSTCQATKELAKAVEQLRRMVHARQKLTDNASSTLSVKDKPVMPGTLTEQVYYYRAQYKLSFEAIASKLAQPVEAVRILYVQAWKEQNHHKVS